MNAIRYFLVAFFYLYQVGAITLRSLIPVAGYVSSASRCSVTAQHSQIVCESNAGRYVWYGIRRRLEQFRMRLWLAQYLVLPRPTASTRDCGCGDRPGTTQKPVDLIRLTGFFISPRPLTNGTTGAYFYRKGARHD